MKKVNYFVNTKRPVLFLLLIVNYYRVTFLFLFFYIIVLIFIDENIMYKYILLDQFHDQLCLLYLIFFFISLT